MSLRLLEFGDQPTDVHEVLIDKEEFVLGRGSDCDLQINEAEISRHHCMFRTRGEEYTLFDLGSSNGTFLNGHRLISQAPLQDGDEVRVGKHRFRVKVGEGEGVIWGEQEGVLPTDTTIKLAKIQKELEEARERQKKTEPPLQ